VRILGAKAIDLGHQGVEANSAESRTEGLPPGLYSSAASHVQYEERPVTPQAVMEYVVGKGTGPTLSAHRLMPSCRNGKRDDETKRS
jgi:hypothetical protein